MKKHTAQFILWSLPNVWLISHVFLQGYAAPGQLPQKTGFLLLADIGALTDFKWYRDRFYVAYIVILAVLGILQMIKNKSGVYTPGKKQSSEILAPFIPVLLQQLILTTFAYAIAALLLDVVLAVR